MCSGTTSGPIFNLLRCLLFLCSILLPTTGLLRDCPTPDFPSLLASFGPEALTLPGRSVSPPSRDSFFHFIPPGCRELHPSPNFSTFCCPPFFSFESGTRGTFVCQGCPLPLRKADSSSVCPVIPLLSCNSENLFTQLLATPWRPSFPFSVVTNRPSRGIGHLETWRM